MNRVSLKWVSSPMTIGAWALCVTVITSLTWSYDLTPGAKAAVVRSWPSETSLQRSDDSARLLCFLHPKCPCSVATVSSLKKLLAESDSADRPSLTFVVYSPPGESSWLETTICRKCREFPDARIYRDEDGREAWRFGATTSGHVLLFSRSGQRLFTGGLTASRGHDGPSAGQEALRLCLIAGAAADREYCVFGCSVTSSGIAPSNSVRTGQIQASEDLRVSR